MANVLNCGAFADAARYCRTPLFRESERPHGVGRIENVRFQGFTCCLPEAPACCVGSGITRVGDRVALQIESNAFSFEMRDFNIVGDIPGDFKALRLRNLENHGICADGKRYAARGKEDCVELGRFNELLIDKEDR